MTCSHVCLSAVAERWRLVLCFTSLKPLSLQMANHGDSPTMAADREARIKAAEVEARFRLFTTKIRCIECGHQSIEDSNADVAVLLRRVRFARVVQQRDLSSGSLA